MILFSTFPKLVTVRQESLVIFTWAGRNDSSSMKVNHPELALIRVYPFSRKVKTSEIPMGEAYDGINVYLIDAGDWFDMPWALFTNIGRIKPGTYSMAIFLKVPPGNQVWYDGFHVFLAKPQKEAQ